MPGAPFYTVENAAVYCDNVIKTGDLKHFKELIKTILPKMGFDPKAVLEFARPPYQRNRLHIAAQENKNEIIAFLLEQKINAAAQDAEGNTPLHLLCMPLGEVKPKNFKRDNFYDPQWQPERFSMRHDIYIKCELSLKLLCNENSCKIDNRAGKNPLDIAAENGIGDIIEYYAENFPVYMNPPGNRKSPLYYAVENGRLFSVRQLMQVGVTVNKDILTLADTQAKAAKGFEKIKRDSICDILKGKVAHTQISPARAAASTFSTKHRGEAEEKEPLLLHDDREESAGCCFGIFKRR